MSSTAPSTDAPGPDVSAADGAARDRAGLFEQIARVSPDIVYVYDLVADRTVYRNRDPRTLIGYGPEEIDAMGPAPWRRIVHGDDVPAVEGARARLAEAADGEVVEFEFRVRRPDGEWRWLAAREVVFERDPGGRPHTVLGQVRDQTAMREALDALKAGEERFRMVLRNAPVTVATQDRDLRYSWVYNPHPDFRDWPMPHDDYAVLPREEAEAVRAVKRGVLESGRGVRFERAYSLPSGRAWYDTTLEPMVGPGGEVEGVAMVTVNTTAFREAEAALALSEERLRLAVEATGLGIWHVDLEGGTRDWSDEFLAIMGLPKGTRPDPDLFSSLIHADDRDRVNAAYAAMYRGHDGGRYRAEFRVLRADTGEERWVQTLGRLYLDADGRPYRAAGTLADVTERRRAEEELRRNEERLRLAQEVGRLGHWDWDIAADEIWWSDSLYRLMGLEPTGSNTRRASAETLDYIHPDDRARVLAAIEEAMRSGSLEIELRAGPPGGPWRWLHERGEVVRDAAGTPVRLIGLAYDITERRGAEESLRESEARFRSLADSAPVMIWMDDTDGRCSFVNRAYLDFFGTTADQVVGMAWAARVHPEDLETYIATYRLAWMEKADVHGEARFRRADGSWRQLRSDGVPRFNADGTFLGYIGCTVDVTDIRRAEGELRLANDVLEARVAERTAELEAANARLAREAVERELAERTYRRLYVRAPVPQYSLDHEGRVLEVSDAMLELAGRRRDEIVGRRIADIFVPDDAPRFRERFARLRELGELQDLDYTLVRPDGEQIPVLVSARLEEGRDGRIRSYAVMQDVRARRHAEAALMREMEERRRAEAALLQAQKMEALGQLTGGVAHDFNNLLQALSGCLHIIARRAGDAQVLQLVEAGNQAIDKGSRLIRQLTAFARRQPLRPEPVALPARLSSMRELLDRSLRGDILVEVEMPGGLWPVLVDPTQLELAVLNLAVNARDAMPEGGTLRLSAENLTLAGGAAEEGMAGDFVRLSIADTGFGMPPEIVSRAFEPFFTTKEVDKGTGLGLAMVYGFARQSGGLARIDSRAGEGTVVSLLLPRSRLAAGQAAAAPVPEAGHADGTVLLVEDDPMVAAAIRGVLDDLGYKVVQASSPAEALAVLREGAAVDLVLSDIVMPGGTSGLDLADTLDRVAPGLPVVLATGYSDMAQSTRLGGRALLQKPYTPQQLADALRRALAGTGQKLTPAQP